MTKKAAKRLPDFLFLRLRWIEREGDLRLAGALVTDITEGKRLRRRDLLIIDRVLDELDKIVERTPDFGSAGFWRKANELAHRLSPRFDVGLLQERCRHCECVVVTSGTKVPSERILGDAVTLTADGRSSQRQQPAITAPRSLVVEPDASP